MFPGPDHGAAGMLVDEAFRNVAVPAHRRGAGECLLQFFRRYSAPLIYLFLGIQKRGRVPEMTHLDLAAAIGTVLPRIPLGSDRPNPVRFRILIDLAEAFLAAFSALRPA